MQSKIDFIWDQLKRKRLKYQRAIEEAVYKKLEAASSYEEDESARIAFQEWQIKMRKNKLEVWAWFGLLMIELDDIYKNLIKPTDPQNFSLKDLNEVHMQVRNNGMLSEQKVEIAKIKDMLKFLRHAYCHPEEKSGLRKDPRVAEILKKTPKEMDHSYDEIIFEDNKGNVFLKVGGGKLYFSEIECAVKIADVLLEKTK